MSGLEGREVILDALGSRVASLRKMISVKAPSWRPTASDRGGWLEIGSRWHRRSVPRRELSPLLARLDPFVDQLFRAGGSRLLDDLGIDAFYELAGDHRAFGRGGEHRADAARRRHSRSVRPFSRHVAQLWLRLAASRGVDLAGVGRPAHDRAVGGARFSARRHSRLQHSGSIRLPAALCRTQEVVVGDQRRGRVYAIGDLRRAGAGRLVDPAFRRRRGLREQCRRLRRLLRFRGVSAHACRLCPTARVGKELPRRFSRRSRRDQGAPRHSWLCWR